MSGRTDVSVLSFFIFKSLDLGQVAFLLPSSCDNHFKAFLAGFERNINSRR